MGQVTHVSSQTLSDMQSPSKFKEKRICTAVTLNCFATNNFYKCFQKTGIFEWLGFGSRKYFYVPFFSEDLASLPTSVFWKKKADNHPFALVHLIRLYVRTNFWPTVYNTVAYMICLANWTVR